MVIRAELPRLFQRAERVAARRGFDTARAATMHQAMRHVIVRELSRTPDREPVEVVERKGIGHPDTLCDALAEHVSVRLSLHYLARFGAILHHNVDKMLLVGGAARVEPGGGEIIEPIEIYVAGRATRIHRGVPIPVDDIAVGACREWLRAHVPSLGDERHVRIIPRLRPGSEDLTSLFARGSARVALANDTSCGAGFAPLTDLERVVLAVERDLNDPATKQRHPELGRDVKVMGVRFGERIHLTVGCAFVARFVAGLDDYVAKKREATARVLEVARRATRKHVEARMNAADDEQAGSIFLTVTGTSAESGDDGQVGRGNRASGLITPYRAMTMEAVAGKNPVSHVGKLYNLAAERIASVLVASDARVTGATCVLVSEIGAPVDDPRLADVQVGLARGERISAVDARAADVVRDELGSFDRLRDDLLSGRARVC